MVCAKMADHSSLAGSIATMDVLVRTMVKAGIPLADAYGWLLKLRDELWEWMTGRGHCRKIWMPMC